MGKSSPSPAPKWQQRDVHRTSPGCGHHFGAKIRTPREHLAAQYEAEGRRALADKVRRGEAPSDSVLRSLRAIQAAQSEALALRTRSKGG